MPARMVGGAYPGFLSPSRTTGLGSGVSHRLFSNFAIQFNPKKLQQNLSGCTRRGSLELLPLERGFHGHASSSRCLVESDRTLSPDSKAQTTIWKATLVRSRLPLGCPIRSAEPSSFANAATGDGLLFITPFSQRKPRQFPSSTTHIVHPFAHFELRCIG